MQGKPYKQCIVLYDEKTGKPVKVAELKSFDDSHDYLLLKQECEKNMREIETANKEKEKELHDMQVQMQVLELRCKYLSGEISRKEFENLCLGMK